MGTIKFLEGKIVTENDGVKEIWIMLGEKTNKFIKYNGITYHLKQSKTEDSE